MRRAWHSLERFCLRLAPGLVTLWLVLFSAVRMPVAALNEILPGFPLISIYYWWIFLPGALPYAFLFLLGLVQDALTGLPMGLSSLLNMSFVYLLTRERHVFGKMLFGSVWIGFVLLSGIIALLQWGLMCAYASAFMPWQPGLFCWGVTALVYPFAHFGFTRLQARMSLVS